MRSSMLQTFVLCVALFIVVVVAQAQEAEIISRIGFLSATPLSAIPARVDAFRLGLRELGHVEGKNILIEFRDGEGTPGRLPAHAAELVRLKVDVIVTGGPTVTRAAKEATLTIPIVMAQDIDPVGSGFIASLSRPGGNITGLSALNSELTGKQLELLKESIPKLARVAVLGTSKTPGYAQSVKETQDAAGILGVQVKYLDVLRPGDFESAFQDAAKARADGLLVLASPLINSQRERVLQLAAKSRLPAIYARSEFVEKGGLMTYGVNIDDLFRRAAIYVDKILKGAKPADLPVEQPTKFELLINRKTAKQIGVAIPPNVLARADRVIK
jgi:ABC-type uncharacterized transport system substrate-binding protein